MNTVCLVIGSVLVFCPWMVSFLPKIVNFTLHHRKRIGKEVLPRLQWTLVFGLKVQRAFHYTVETYLIREVLTVWDTIGGGFFFSGDHDYRLLVNGFLPCFFPWVFSFSATVVNSKLPRRTKGIEKTVIPRVELGSSDSESEVLTTKSYNLPAFKTSLCCVSCYCWCVFWSWPAFVG